MPPAGDTTRPPHPLRMGFSVGGYVSLRLWEGVALGDTSVGMAFTGWAKISLLVCLGDGHVD